MGTIHEFPQWRAQPPQAKTGVEAQVVIFTGVRIERDASAGNPVPRHAGPANSPDCGRQTRKRSKS